MKQIMCLDAGGMSIKYNMRNSAGELLVPTRAIPKPPDKESFVAAIEQLVKESEHQVDGLAFSMPGFLDSQSGYMIGGGALDYLQDIQFFELFSQLGIPVSIENDARSAALAEVTAGNAQGCENFACLTLGTGVGCALMVHGKFITGTSFKGGEFGSNIMVAADQSYQTYHATASMSALLRDYKLAKGLALDTPVDGAAIFEEAQSDAAIAAIVDQWYLYVGIAICNLATTFNGEKILIGGGVSAHPGLLAGIEKAVQQLIPGPLWQLFAVPVDICKFHNDAGCLGAYYHFQAMHG